MTQEMIPGIAITAGGQVWIVPPLNFKALKRMSGQIATLATLNKATMNMEALAAAAEVVLAALHRNYPDLTLDQLEEFMDLGNSAEFVLAVLTASRVKKKEELVTGEPNLGEVRAAV